MDSDGGDTVIKIRILLEYVREDVVADYVLMVPGRGRSEVRVHIHEEGVHELVTGEGKVGSVMESLSN